MRTNVRNLSVLAALAAASLAGCAPPHAVILKVDAGAYHVRGDYMGSQKHVKLFVERLLIEPTRSGRGSMVRIKLVLLNERAEACTLDCAKVHLEVGSQRAPAVETHMIRIEAGELRPVSLNFRTGERPDDVGGGTLELDGLSPETPGGPKPSFRVPFSATDTIVEADEH